MDDTDSQGSPLFGSDDSDSDSDREADNVTKGLSARQKGPDRKPGQQTVTSLFDCRNSDSDNDSGSGHTSRKRKPNNEPEPEDEHQRQKRLKRLNKCSKAFSMVCKCEPKEAAATFKNGECTVTATF